MLFTYCTDMMSWGFSYKSLCIYSMHPMQPNINLYLCSYKSLCIYAMHASYANEYINLYIFCSMSLCIYAMHTSYAALYKLVYIVFYESMAYACILRYNWIYKVFCYI